MKTFDKGILAGQKRFLRQNAEKQTKMQHCKVHASIKTQSSTRGSNASRYSLNGVGKMVYGGYKLLQPF